MIPRGINYAAPGAENSLLNILPQPGKTDPVVERSVDRQPRKRENDFSKNLKREVERRENPTRQDPESSKTRKDVGRQDRTKESSHGSSHEKPDAVLNRRAQGKPVRKTDNGKSEAVERVPIGGEVDATSLIEHQAKELFDLVQQLEEWIINFLDQMQANIGNQSEGPGDSIRLSGIELGPRFDINTLIPTQAGKLEELLAGILDSSKNQLPSDGKLDLAHLLDLFTARINPNENLGVKPELETVLNEIKQLIEQLEPVTREFVQLSNTPVPVAGNEPAISLDQLLKQLKVDRFDITGQLKQVDPNQLQAVRLTDVQVKSETDNQVGHIEHNMPVIRNLGPVVIEEASTHSTKLVNDHPSVQNFNAILEKLSELIARANRIILDKASSQSTEAPKSILIPESPLPTNLNPGQNIFHQIQASSVTRDQVRIETPVMIEEVDRIVQNVGRENINAIRLRLHPPELGNLVIQFRRDENGLRIEFHTPHSAVQKVLTEAAPKMMERLAGAGVDIDSLDVFLGNPGNGDEKSFSPLDDPSKPPVRVEKVEFDETDEPGHGNGSGINSVYGRMTSSSLDVFA